MTERSKMQTAFKTLEHVFITLKNGKMHESNRHPLGHPDRQEHDFDEMDKAHLDLLRAKMDMEIAEKINKTLEEASKSSDQLGNKVFWLNIAMVVLSLVIAGAAIAELWQ